MAEVSNDGHIQYHLDGIGNLILGDEEHGEGGGHSADILSTLRSKLIINSIQTGNML